MTNQFPVSALKGSTSATHVHAQQRQVFYLRGVDRSVANPYNSVTQAVIGRANVPMYHYLQMYAHI